MNKLPAEVWERIWGQVEASDIVNFFQAARGARDAVLSTVPCLRITYTNRDPTALATRLFNALPQACTFRKLHLHGFDHGFGFKLSVIYSFLHALAQCERSSSKLSQVRHLEVSVSHQLCPMLCCAAGAVLCCAVLCCACAVLCGESR